MKEIKLTQGKITLVDDEDFEYINQWKWHVIKNKKQTHFYAQRSENGKSIRMHRVIMKTPHNKDVDHIDHNGLNNQKNNLRNCTTQENIRNRTSYGKSSYLGVSTHLAKYKNKSYS